MEPDDFSVRIEKLELMLDEIKTTLDSIEATMIRADTAVAKIASDVMPVVQELSSSPMIRMLTGGKKK